MRFKLLSLIISKWLLEEFVEKHGSGLEVVYALCGWLKSSPPSYNIKLVSGPKLAEAKLEFDGSCSVQVYSVQASIPNDPAALWNAEYVQAEELFKQRSLDNCLRDNRFCGISNSFVKCNVDGTSVSIADVQPKSSGIPQLSKSNSMVQNNSVPPPQQNKIQQSNPKVSLLSATVVKDVKAESNSIGVHDQAIEKVNTLLASKKKGQNDKSSSGNGGSLASLWGRASTKEKPNSAAAVDNTSAEAQISVREAAENSSSDDDAKDVNFRRASNGEGNRKRKAVFDLSDEDEYEDTVNLGSPDPPKGKSDLIPKENKKLLVIGKPDLISNELKEDKLEAKEEKETNGESNQSTKENSAAVSKLMKSETSFTEKAESFVPQNDINKDKVVNSVPNSAKRKKVLKTHIDERGREVTEVVWEGEETEIKRADSETMNKADNEMTKKADSNPTKKAGSNTVTGNSNRPSAAKKSPALGSTVPSNPGSKAAAKKGGNPKDPKQGNILSFFKRV
ncbi:uncharacterized protein LOC123195692 isoform X2 [Mangifera indica]|uniref:uncharacterized protein LOC123195692 isoform X2 n=1 Tax=Mangifera indica TaxID=29780 RepID=UPI001CFB1A74|nr:uncharacterized protein LOC123195692 isoform X2 [Mangifera indica]